MLSLSCLRPGRSLQTAPRLPLRRLAAARGFTLLELMVVIALMVMLMALIAPAFTNLKSASDVTSVAYTIKGALDQARTYAQANNTYTWVGFLEENVANPSPDFC